MARAKVPSLALEPAQEQAALLLQVPLGTLKTRVRAGVLSLRSHLAAAAA